MRRNYSEGGVGWLILQDASEGMKLEWIILQKRGMILKGCWYCGKQTEMILGEIQYWRWGDTAKGEMIHVRGHWERKDPGGGDDAWRK